MIRTPKKINKRLQIDHLPEWSNSQEYKNFFYFNPESISHESDIPMKPIVILPLVMMLLLATFVPACITPAAPDPSPQGILKTYIQKVNDRDTQAVRDALSSRLKLEYEHAYETTRQDPVHDALYGLERQGATIQTVTIINQTITGQNATIVVDYFWHYPGIFQINKRRQVVEFINEDGAWKLNTFFPFEEPGLIENSTEFNLIPTNNTGNASRSL